MSSPQQPSTGRLERLRRDGVAIARAGTSAVSAALLVERALLDAEVDEELIQSPLHVVAAGKASPFMAAAFARAVGKNLRRGIVVGTHCPLVLPGNLKWHQGGHPVPTSDSLAAGAHALWIAQTMEPRDRLIVLISGGTSALLAVPVEGVSLDDKKETTRRLLAAGADIYALNTVRKHVSRIKGGQLAAAARGRTLAFVISDVVGDDLSVIGSGPTVPDPSTYNGAIAILDDFGGRDRFPPAVVEVLERGAEGRRPETPKRGSRSLRQSTTRIIGTRRDALAGALEAAETLGYKTFVIDQPVIGEARLAAGPHLAAVDALAERFRCPTCVLSAGETTVRVVGTGRGGRNQELALAAVEAISASGREMVMVSVGTDGIDGPTDAAGAIVDTTTLQRAQAAGLKPPEHYLNHNDSYSFFSPLGDLVVTGPTDTNVGDLQVVLVR
jgi:glycerate 2-kinase